MTETLGETKHAIFHLCSHVGREGNVGDTQNSVLSRLPTITSEPFFLLTYFSTVLSFEAPPPLYSYYSLPILITVITHFQTTPPRSSPQAPGSSSSFTPQVVSQSSWLIPHREDPRNMNGTVVWPTPYNTLCSTSPSLSQEIPHTLSSVRMAAFLRSRALKLHSTSFL